MTAVIGYYGNGGRLILHQATSWGISLLTAVSEIDVRRSRAFKGARRSDDNRVFRSAVRHSRLVRFLRFGVPLGVALGVATVVAVTWVKPLRLLTKLPVDIGSLVVSGSKVTMQQPRLAGFTRDQRQYEMTAQAASQDLTNPDVVELQGIRAKMEMQDKLVFETTAQSGVFQTKTELLTLQHNIVVTSSDGYKARLAEAVVDIRANTIVSEKPVEVTTATLTINANRMEIAESGDLIRFERGVSVTLMAEGDAIHLVSKAGKP